MLSPKQQCTCNAFDSAMSFSLILAIYLGRVSSFSNYLNFLVILLLAFLVVSLNLAISEHSSLFCLPNSTHLGCVFFLPPLDPYGFIPFKIYSQRVPSGWFRLFHFLLIYPLSWWLSNTGGGKTRATFGLFFNTADTVNPTFPDDTKRYKSMHISKHSTFDLVLAIYWAKHWFFSWWE